MTVIDLSAFEIEIDIPENYADDISIGAEAEINYEGRVYSGRVSSVSQKLPGNPTRIRPPSIPRTNTSIPRAIRTIPAGFWWTSNSCASSSAQSA